MPLEQGNLLNGRYRIIEVLGHGGMGSVYRAHDESLSVDVAVKENLFTTEDYARQFRLEAVILASLRHPNLPRVFDHFVLPNQGQYLVMDYIPGPDLRQILEKEGPITEEEAIRIGTAICDALTYLHTRKPAILHRDIKLGNIKLLPDGNISLVDFGLAKIIEGDQPTMTGARAMTPGYSPPEQYGSSRTDARSDIYSLGATLYAALTGFIPEDSLARALEGLPLTPIRKRNPKISARLAAVIEKAMDPVPAQRYQSAEEFKRALLGETEPESQPAGEKSASQPPPAVLPEKPTRPALLKPRNLLLLALMLLLTLLGLVYTNPGGFVFAPATATFTATATQSAPLTTAVVTATVTSTTAPTATQTPPVRPTATQTDLPQPSPTLQPLPTSLGGGGKIAFATTREGNLTQIYLMSADGSGQERLFLAADGACQPRWSPDGRKLAFITPCRGRQLEYPNATIQIYNLESNQIETTLPTMSGGDFDPAWSPDSNAIVFTSLRDKTSQSPGFSQIYKIDLNSQEVTRLTQTDVTQPARQPAWSPDGKSILYSLQRFGLWQIWSMAVDGSNPTQVLRSGARLSDIQPAWAPDGLAFYFSQSSGDSPTLLMRFNLGETNALRVGRSIRAQDARVSPDGRWLVFEGTDGSNIDIYLLDLSNPESQPQRLTDHNGIDFDPDWQP